MKRKKLNIRVTDKEKELIKERAQAQGITISKLVLQSVSLSK